MIERAVIAANRFGLGARPGETGSIGDNAIEWLLQQIPGPSRSYPALTNLGSSAKVLAEVIGIRQMQREARRKAADGDLSLIHI